jgi:hypothetical protein
MRDVVRLLLGDGHDDADYDDAEAGAWWPGRRGRVADSRGWCGTGLGGDEAGRRGGLDGWPLGRIGRRDSLGG